MKNLRIEFSPEAEKVFAELLQSKTKLQRMLHAAVEHKISLLHENSYYGDHVQKFLIPRVYRDSDITNIFRVDLPAFWRMIYTIGTRGQEPIVLILDILNHKDYDKLFC